MNLRKVKLIVWHKTEKALYEVLRIDWNNGTVSLERQIGRKDSPNKIIEGLRYESIDSVVLAEIRFIDILKGSR